MRSAMMMAFLAAATVAAAQKPPVDWQPADPNNYTAVSYDRGIKYVVIHTADGSYWGTISWFKNPSAKVSAHYVVSKGGAIAQCVKDKDIAWHAGNWTYNKHSIGIEHEGYTYQNGWTDAQYKASAKLTRWICLTYGIPMDRQHIIGHIEVPGATHTDPGPYFDWTYYMNLVKNGTTSGGGSTGGSTASGGGTMGGTTGGTTTSGTKVVKINASTLNVRSGPGTNYGIIGTIPYGQTYVSIGTANGWYKIWYNGSAGYIYGGYASATSGYVAQCTVSTLNVRTGPGTGYSIVGTMSNGQIYSLISSTSWSTGWNKIYFGGGAYYSYAGYMSEYYLN